MLGIQPVKYRRIVSCRRGSASCIIRRHLDDTARDALYEQYLCKELVDFTRKVFPISREREEPSIGGLPMGGYGAIRNGLKNNDIFGNIIALSSALLTDNIINIANQKNDPLIAPCYFIHTFGKPEAVKGSDVDPKALAKKLAEGSDFVPNIFMACGTEDILIAENRDFNSYLNVIGIEHVYLEGPGTHEWAFWDNHIEKALIWLESLR